jgi:UDP-glucose 4-epimerase
MDLTAKIEYTGGRQGWVGDNPFVFLDVTKIQSEGWSPKNNIKDSIRETVEWLNSNTWIFDGRQ